MKKQRSDLVAELFFNEGILSEILSWLEVKYVYRFKSVCKFWYAIINNEQFVELHRSHNGRLSYHCIKCKGLDTESINSDGTKQKIRYLDRSCPGFLLVKRSSDSDKPSATYRLSNPSTKSILDLPDPQNRVRSMSIFQDSSTKSYYVYSVGIHQENEKPIFEILHLGGQSNDPTPNANLCWTTLEIPEYDKLSKKKYKLIFVASKGILYILVLRRVGFCNPTIICFDLVKQRTCTTLDMPDQNLCLNSRNVLFQLFRGKPTVTYVLDGKLKLWVLEDYKNQKWADMIQISLLFLKENPSLKFIPYICCDDNGELGLLCGMGKKEYCVYNPKSKERTFPSSPYRVPATLVSVKGMQLCSRDSSLQ